MRRRFVKVNGKWRRVREVHTFTVRLTPYELVVLRQYCERDRLADPTNNRPLTVIPKLDRALARSRNFYNKKGR